MKRSCQEGIEIEDYLSDSALQSLITSDKSEPSKRYLFKASH